MADINLGSTIAPGGPFPIARDTDLLGGLRVVATTVARDAIIAANKTVGMFVQVQADGKLYRLDSIGPDVYTEFGSGVAAWAAGTIRHFALDYDNGSDAGVGFSDATVTAAGAVAKKTWEGLEAIIPKIGANRRFDITIRSRAAGALYKKQDTVTDADIDLRGLSGYAYYSVRATDTIASAGSVAFADDANDQICMGARSATNANAAGYKVTKTTWTIVGAEIVASGIVIEHTVTPGFTLASGDRIMISGANDEFGNGCIVNGLIWHVTAQDATHIRLTASLQNTTPGTNYFPDMATCGGTITRYRLVKADNSAAALQSETTVASSFIGLRLRGDVANATNSNVAVGIMGNGASTIVPTAAFAPDPAEIWYIEEPSAAFLNAYVSGGNGVDPANLSLIPEQTQIAGIRVTGTTKTALTIFGMSQGVRAVFCRAQNGMTVHSCESVNFSPTWLTSAGVGRAIGSGGIVRTEADIQNVRDFVFNAAGFIGTAAFFSLTNVPKYQLVNTSLLGPVKLIQCGASATTPTIPNVSGCRISSGAGDFTADNSHGYFVDTVIAGTFAIIGDNGSWRFSNITTGPISAFGEAGLQIEGTDNHILFTGSVNFNGAESNAGVEVGFYQIQIGANSGVPRVYFYNCGDLYFSDIRDVFGNHFSRLNGTAGIVVSSVVSSMFSWDGVLPLERFHIVRTDVAGMVLGALADSAANASGALMSADNLASPGTGVDANCVADGLRWIFSDDVPAINDMMYLSPTTPGYATKTTPVVSGGNQKRRIGPALNVTTDFMSRNLVLVRWQPEMLSVNADGNP